MANEKGNIDTKHTKSSILQLKYCEIKTRKITVNAELSGMCAACTKWSSEKKICCSEEIVS